MDRRQTRRTRHSRCSVVADLKSRVVVSKVYAEKGGKFVYPKEGFSIPGSDGSDSDEGNVSDPEMESFLEGLESSMQCERLNPLSNVVRCVCLSSDGVWRASDGPTGRPTMANQPPDQPPPTSQPANLPTNTTAAKQTTTQRTGQPSHQPPDQATNHPNHKPTNQPFQGDAGWPTASSAASSRPQECQQEPASQQPSSKR